MTERGKQTIEIDCAPGYPRPGDLIGRVIKDTELPSRSDVFRFMGLWVWDYNDIDPEIWKRTQPILKERLTKLYNDGMCRYCSW